MRSDQVRSRFQLLLGVVAMPALAAFIAGCKSDDVFFSDPNIAQPAPAIVAPADSAPPMPPSPFVQYDNALIGAISNQWFKAVNTLTPKPPAGTVVLAFQLNLNGTINGLKVVQSDENQRCATLCEQAVLDAAPFDSWPEEMRQACPDGYRDIHYRFDFK